MDSNTKEVLSWCVQLLERVTYPYERAEVNCSSPTTAQWVLRCYVKTLHELREYLPSIGVDMKHLSTENYGRQDFSKHPLPKSFEPFRRRNRMSDRVAWCHFFMLMITECLRDALTHEDLGLIKTDLWYAATFVVHTNDLNKNNKSLVPSRSQLESWRIARFESSSK